MTDKKTLRRVLAYIRGSLGKIILTLILALGIVGMTLYVPILIGDAIDLCVEGGGIDFAAILSLSPVIIAILVNPKALSSLITSAASSRRGSSIDITAASFPSIAMYK